MNLPLLVILASASPILARIEKCNDLFRTLFDPTLSDASIITEIRELFKEKFNQDVIPSSMDLSSLIQEIFVPEFNDIRNLVVYSEEQAGEKADKLVKALPTDSSFSDSKFDEMIQNLLKVYKFNKMNSCEKENLILNKPFDVLFNHLENKDPTNAALREKLIDGLKRMNINALEDQMSEVLKGIQHFKCFCFDRNQIFYELESSIKEWIPAIKNVLDNLTTKTAESLANRYAHLFYLFFLGYPANAANDAYDLFEGLMEIFYQDESKTLIRDFAFNLVQKFLSLVEKSNGVEKMANILPKFSLFLIRAVKLHSLMPFEFIISRCEKGCTFEDSTFEDFKQTKLLAFEFLNAASFQDFKLRYDPSILTPIVRNFAAYFTFSKKELQRIAHLYDLLDSIQVFHENNLRTEYDKAAFAGFLNLFNLFVAEQSEKDGDEDFFLRFDRFIDLHSSNEKVKNNYHLYKVANLITGLRNYDPNQKIKLKSNPESVTSKAMKFQRQIFSDFFKMFDICVEKGEATVGELVNLIGFEIAETKKYVVKSIENEQLNGKSLDIVHTKMGGMQFSVNDVDESTSKQNPQTQSEHLSLLSHQRDEDFQTIWSARIGGADISRSETAHYVLIKGKEKNCKLEIFYELVFSEKEGANPSEKWTINDQESSKDVSKVDFEKAIFECSHSKVLEKFEFSLSPNSRITIHYTSLPTSNEPGPVLHTFTDKSTTTHQKLDTPEDLLNALVQCLLKSFAEKAALDQSKTTNAQHNPAKLHEDNLDLEEVIEYKKPVFNPQNSNENLPNQAHTQVSKKIEILNDVDPIGSDQKPSKQKIDEISDVKLLEVQAEPSILLPSIITDKTTAPQKTFADYILENSENVPLGAKTRTMRIYLLNNCATKLVQRIEADEESLGDIVIYVLKSGEKATLIERQTLIDHLKVCNGDKPLNLEALGLAHPSKIAIVKHLLIDCQKTQEPESLKEQYELVLEKHYFAPNAQTEPALITADAFDEKVQKCMENPQKTEEEQELRSLPTLSMSQVQVDKKEEELPPTIIYRMINNCEMEEQIDDFGGVQKTIVYEIMGKDGDFEKVEEEAYNEAVAECEKNGGMPANSFTQAKTHTGKPKYLVNEENQRLNNFFMYFFSDCLVLVDYLRKPDPEGVGDISFYIRHDSFYTYSMPRNQFENQVKACQEKQEDPNVLQKGPGTKITHVIDGCIQDVTYEIVPDSFLIDQKFYIVGLQDKHWEVDAQEYFDRLNECRNVDISDENEELASELRLKNFEDCGVETYTIFTKGHEKFYDVYYALDPKTQHPDRVLKDQFEKLVSECDVDYDTRVMMTGHETVRRVWFDENCVLRKTEETKENQAEHIEVIYLKKNGPDSFEGIEYKDFLLIKEKCESSQAGNQLLAKIPVNNILKAEEAVSKTLDQFKNIIKPTAKQIREDAAVKNVYKLMNWDCKVSIEIEKIEDRFNTGDEFLYVTSFGGAVSEKSETQFYDSVSDCAKKHKVIQDANKPGLVFEFLLDGCHLEINKRENTLSPETTFSYFLKNEQSVYQPISHGAYEQKWEQCKNSKHHPAQHSLSSQLIHVLKFCNYKEESPGSLDEGLRGHSFVIIDNTGTHFPDQESFIEALNACDAQLEKGPTNKILIDPINTVTTITSHNAPFNMELRVNTVDEPNFINVVFGNVPAGLKKKLASDPNIINHIRNDPSFLEALQAEVSGKELVFIHVSRSSSPCQ